MLSRAPFRASRDTKPRTQFDATIVRHTWTNGMGVMANAQLTAAIADAPWLEFPYDPPEWDLDRRDDILAEPVAVDADGFLVLPDVPGMGMMLDEDRLTRTRVG